MSASEKARFREIEVSGPPRELGRQIGDAAGEEIRGFCEIALQRVNKSINISRAAALAVARDSLPFAERYSPEMVEELRGTAEASGVSLDDLMLLQVRNQLQPEQPACEAGCTSLSLDAPFATGRFVAQNWDNDPALDPFTIVLTRRPAGRPAFTSLTQAGLIAYIGSNDAGIGLCLNTLPAPSRRVGVPHYFTVRGILEADSLDGAVAAVRRAERAIPANIMLTTPQGPADLEVTLDAVHVLHPQLPGRLTHTNHCRHPELASINDRFPELIQSHSRQARIDDLLDRRPPGEWTLGRIQDLLRDHNGHPRSICRHANDDPATGYWQTVFSVVIEPAATRMHITRGNPCTQRYESYPAPPV
jgi:isopenicillin-N N-acyltransferase-like protein